MTMTLRATATTAVIGLAAALVAWYATGGAPPSSIVRVGPTGPIPAYTLPLKAGVPADAEIAFYRRRVAKDPERFLDQNLLAGAYLRKARETGDPAWRLMASRAAAASLRAMPRDNPDALLVGAQVAIAQHRFDEGRRIVAKVSQQYPAAPVAGLLATLDLAQGRPAQAAKTLARLRASGPSSAGLAQLGLALAATGDDAGAEATFRDAIAREQPGDRLTSADARTWLGRLYLRRGRLEEAEALFTEAVRIWPGHLQALGLAAELLARQGRSAEADRAWQALADRRHDPGPMVMRARLAIRAGDRPAAEALWADAERRLRQDLAAGVFDHRRELVALLLDRARAVDLEEAVKLSTAERAMREDAETLDLLAGALLALGRTDEAARAMAVLEATGAREAPYQFRAAAIAQAQGETAAVTARIAAADAIDATFRGDPAFRVFEPLVAPRP